MKSHFLEQFKRLKAEGADLLKLYGDIILVEGHTAEETKTSSGIIIASSDKNTNGFGQNLLSFYTVLYVGEGYYDDETKEDVPLDVQPGDIIVTGLASVKEISKFGPVISTKEHRLCLARVEDIQIRFPGGEGSYEKVSSILTNVT